MIDKLYGGRNPEPEGVDVPLEKPDVEDCASDIVPEGVRSIAGKKVIKQADLVSMFRYLLTKNYANRRGELIHHLNTLLWNGTLSDIVGFEILDKRIYSKACDFQHVSFWKINRECFYADIDIVVELTSCEGKRSWKGVFACVCSFEDGDDFDFEIDKLTNKIDRPAMAEALGEEMIPLSPFLVPYLTNQQMDAFGERVWIDYGLPEAIKDPSLRNATKLAERIGLTIQYLNVFEHQNMDSIIFFEDSDLVVGEDRVERQPDGTEQVIKTTNPITVRIPANTIVVNTNKIRRDYSAFNIFHECIHFLLHYAFFRLQRMASNDKRLLKVVEVEVEDDKQISDPIYFMEKQADRGAFALLMPASDTKERIVEERSKVTEYKNEGDRYEKVGKTVSRQLKVPHFRMKARMIQLGFIEAKGALNYGDDRKLITPFAFNTRAWESSELTFVVREGTTRLLYNKNDAFREVMDTGKFVFADGHVVRNHPRYVRKENEKLFLTEEAAKRVDVCCLRFVRTYVQSDVGDYHLGRMFYDPHYVEQTLFYLSDTMNKEKLDDLDAKIEYEASFPRSFKKAFDMIMEQNSETRETTAYRLHISEDTLARWLEDPEHKITLDFIVRITLMWQIPDFISDLLLDRGMVKVGKYDRRHQALEYVRTVLWDKSIEEANDYLKSKKVGLLESFVKEKVEARKRRSNVS